MLPLPAKNASVAKAPTAMTERLLFNMTSPWMTMMRAADEIFSRGFRVLGRSLSGIGAAREGRALVRQEPHCAGDPVVRPFGHTLP